MSISPDRFLGQLNSDISRGTAFMPEASTEWAVSARMHQYHDELLAEWLEWDSRKHAVWNEKLGYSVPWTWVDASRSCHERVVQQVLGRTYDAQQYEHIDFYNATDYLFQTLLGKGKKILDFGAGYGRQAFLWTAQSSSLAYIAVDGIEGPYLLQNKVFESLEDIELHEYVEDPDSFSILAPVEDICSIYHLPTWRLDLVPDGFLDLIICVQVLQELPGLLVQPLLDQFQRVVAPGGKLYIRDHEYWRPSHHFKIGRYLLQNGWRLAFRHPGIDKRDIHGIPRIWSYTREDTSDLLSVKRMAKRLYWYVRYGKPMFGDVLDNILPV